MVSGPSETPPLVRLLALSGCRRLSLHIAPAIGRFPQRSRCVLVRKRNKLLLRPGEKTRACHRVCCTNFHAVEGAGHVIVGGRRLDRDNKDVFTVPTRTFCEDVNSGDGRAFLFSFSDAPVTKALSLYREEKRA